jgi:pimeloyl-ACP methyl ester carboxylesterase
MLNIVYLHGFASGPLSTKGRFFHSRFEVIGGEVQQPQLDEGDFSSLTITKQLAVIDRAVKECKPALLMGSSLGGYLAALYAARHPDLIPALVLLAPAFGFPRRWSTQLGEEAMAAWRQKGAREVYHYGERRMLPVGYALYEDGLKYEEYPEVSQPTLVFHGRYDEVVDPALSVQFAWGKPHVTLELLESDHQLLDVLEPIWEAVAPFYQNLEPQRA